MRRREFLATVTGVAGSRLCPAADGQRPNVLILQPDQHRGITLGCAGDEQAKTPHLDRLAAGGIRFSRTVSSSPVCSPFRGSMQTGLYCHTHGVVRNNIRLDPKLTTIAEVFRLHRQVASRRGLAEGCRRLYSAGAAPAGMAGVARL